MYPSIHLSTAIQYQTNLVSRFFHWLLNCCLIAGHGLNSVKELQNSFLMVMKGIHSSWMIIPNLLGIELDDGKIDRKALYLMVKTMVSCRFSLKPIH